MDDAAIAAQLTEILERLGAVETAMGLNRSDVRDGYTRWLLSDGDAPYISIGASINETDVGLYVYDDDGERVAFLGTAIGPGAMLRMENDDRSGAVLQTFGGQLLSPLIASAWQHYIGTTLNANGYAITASASYVDCWKTLLPCTTGIVTGSIDLNVTAGGNTAAFRLQVRRFDTAGSFVTLDEITGVTGYTSWSELWTVPDTVNSPEASPIGGLLELALQARRTAGANEAACAPQLPMVNYYT